MPVAFAEIENRLTEKDQILLCDNVPFSGVIRTMHDLEITEYQYISGKKHGIQKLYYLSGQIKEVTMFTNGIENGRSVAYHEDGSKKMNVNYNNGQFDGLYELWSLCGRLLERKTYYKGRLISSRI